MPVVIAKIYDSSSPVSALVHPNADYTAHEAEINRKLREAVVKYQLKSIASDDKPLDVRYDLNGTGTLTYDIAENGGREFDAIKRAFKDVDPEAVRVAIVRHMKSYYYLLRPAGIGESFFTVKGDYVTTGTMQLGHGETREVVKVVASSGGLVRLASPLKRHHPPGTPVQTLALGWSGSVENGDPILIQEGDNTIDAIADIIVHEVGHTAFGLGDVDDETNVMHHNDENTESRLRFCPRKLHYEQNEVENQWEKIPRP